RRRVPGAGLDALDPAQRGHPARGHALTPCQGGKPGDVESADVPRAQPLTRELGDPSWTRRAQVLVEPFAGVVEGRSGERGEGGDPPTKSWVCDGVPAGDRAPVVTGEMHWTIGADGVDHRPEIVDEMLEGESVGRCRGGGGAHATLVVADDVKAGLE